jgi:RNA polymerase sigma-70 factor (ECF subfamily)
VHRDDGWFERLYTDWYPQVVAYFVRRGFPLEEARELAQDVFERVYRGMDKFRSAASPRTWLFSIAHNHWANEIRRLNTGSRQARAVSLDSASPRDDEAAVVERIASPNPSPDAIAEVNEQQRQLAAAIVRLSVRQRTVLLLQIHGLSYKEIASVLGVKLETIKSLRHDALKALKQMLPGTRLHLDEADDEGGAP